MPGTPLWAKIFEGRKKSFGEKLGENDRRKGRKTTGKGRENDRRKVGERKLIKGSRKGCKSLTEGRKGKRTALVWTMRAVSFSVVVGGEYRGKQAEKQAGKTGVAKNGLRLK